MILRRAGDRLAAMIIKRTAFVMTLWLLCHQALAVIAVAAVIPAPFESHGTASHEAMHSNSERPACHQQSAVDHANLFDASAEMPSSHLVHSQHAGDQQINSDVNCCDQECRCCASGCHSALPAFDSAALKHAVPSYSSYYLFFSLQTSVESLYRPPIVL